MRRWTIGAAVLLLGATACGSHHGAAPANRHLVYVAGSDPAHSYVWIADVDGSHGRRLGRGLVAILTPDGKTIAVRRNDGIYLMSTTGRVLRRLTPRRIRPGAWSPDGRTLIATRAGPLDVIELDAIDRRTGHVRVIAAGSIYGFDFSPRGDQIVYARAAIATGQGPCADQIDLYVVPVTGGTPRQITHDGGVAFPVWGTSGIAFSRFPGVSSVDDCSAPGIWAIDTVGSTAKPIVVRSPTEFVGDGLYGLQPLAWLDRDHLLIGIRSFGGTQGAVLDTRSHKIHRLADYADEASSDGRFVVGSGEARGAIHLTIQTADGKRIFHRDDACCPDWNR
jgi:dipeptidyl aminopeptidase/acylaminoacyl peptidase